GRLGEQNLQQLMDDHMSDEDSTVWKQLIDAYEKRTHFSKQNIYQANARVSKENVVNWLQQTVTHYTSLKESQPVNVIAEQPIPMSQVQQYTIHIENIDQVERISDELINKFQTIIRESRFLQIPNQGSQLTITLQPENLGNMTVRFAQINGEMVVKILVSSQVAREMLESNVHQLKHMFSPHQIVIEKDDLLSDENGITKDNKQEMLDDRESNDPSNSDKREDETETDFKTVIAQLEEEVNDEYN